MSESTYPVNIHESYHAHIYFDHSTIEQARAFCELIAHTFPFPVGRIHERPIGPHPVGSCQVLFRKNEFNLFIPWLDEHRDGLTILVHGVTGDDLKDHTDYAYWLGEPAKLNLSMFQKK